MTSQEKSKIIMSYFDEILPDAGCELEYTTNYSFLIAVMLSAQTTDKKVNKVTKVLFDKYKDLESLSKAKYEDVFEIVKPLGLGEKKAENVISIAKDLIEKFHSEVPINKFELMSLSGVGNKTANVVQVELFKIPQFPVDTHIERISKRLGLVSEKANVRQIENELRNIFPEEKWINLHHQFIHFGRYYCKAISPHCENCKLAIFCKKPC